MALQQVYGNSTNFLDMSPLISHLNETIHLNSKSPAYVAGEQFIKPLIDSTYNIGCRFWSVLQWGASSLDTVVSRIFQFPPLVSATSISQSQQDQLQRNNNDREALKNYLEDAKKGIPVAQLIVGAFHEEGRIVKQSYEEAFKWYQKAADKGERKALYQVGLFYEKGLGIKQDHEKAVECWIKAAEKGEILSQEKLDELNIDYRKPRKGFPDR